MVRRRRRGKLRGIVGDGDGDGDGDGERGGDGWDYVG